MKTAGMKSFSYQAPVIWNNLSIKVRDSRSLHAFKRSLKTHLFEQAFSEIQKVSILLGSNCCSGGGGSSAVNRAEIHNVKSY